MSTLTQVSESVVFKAKPESLSAEWTAMDAESTGSISFGGGEGAEVLNKIVGIAQARHDHPAPGARARGRP